MSRISTDNTRWPLRFDPATPHRYRSVWPGRNLIDFIGDYLQRKANAVAVVDRGARYTFAQVMQSVEAMASALESLGIGSGDVVTFQLPNWVQAVVLHLACLRIGAVVNPVVPIYREKELNYILEDAGTALLVIPDTYRGFDYPALAARLHVKPRHIMVCGDPVPGLLHFDTLLREFAGKHPEGASIHPDALSYLLYTSGTEADPKGVEHTQNILLFDLINMIEMNRIDDHDVLFGASPVTHVTGLVYTLILPFIRGNKVCLFDTWVPAEAARIIEQERCTWTVGATPFLRDLLYNEDARKHDISSLRSFRCGGADVPPSLILDAQAHGLRAYRSYGCTEHPTISGVLYSDETNSATTDGLLHSHIEMKCVDPDDASRVLGSGEIGEILTRGPDMSMGYHRPELNDKAFDEDGWFRTGDLGFLDADRYITITGRKKDIVIRKGENISTKELENILVRHPGVAEIAVIGMPDGERGERVCAVVVPRTAEGFTFADMTAILQEAGVARQKFPEQLELLESLPTTAAGKVRKSQIRKDLIEAMEQKQA